MQSVYPFLLASFSTKFLYYYAFADAYLQFGHSISRSNFSTDPSYYSMALLLAPVIIFAIGIISLIILNFAFLFRYGCLLKG